MLPGSPTNFAYAASTKTSISVQWDAPLEVHALQVPVTQYEALWRDVSAGGPWNTEKAAPSSRIVTVVGLATSNFHKFYLRACNINGCGAYTSALDLLSGDLPEAPNTPFPASTSNDAITVGWTYDGKDSGGVALTRFDVKVSSDAGITYTAAGSTADASVFTFKYVCSQQAQFYFKVAAVNYVGVSPDSVAVPMFCAALPAAPDSAALVTATDSLTVSLPTPTRTELNNARHLGWRIFLDDLNSTDTLREHFLWDSKLSTFTFLNNIITGHAYQLKMQLCSQAGCSVESPYGAPVYAASPPASPTQTFVSFTSNTHVGIGWRFGGSSGGVSVTGWNIYISPDGVTWSALSAPAYAISGGEVSTHTQACNDVASGIYRENGVLYFRVAATSAAGIGTLSDTLAVRCSAPAESPATPSVVSQSTQSITIKWNKLSLNAALYVGTKLYFDDGLGGPFDTILLTDPTQTTFTKVDVVAGLPYRFKVQIVTEVGESVVSPILSVVAASVPDAPVLTILGSSNTAVFLGWTLHGSANGSPIYKWEVFVADEARQSLDDQHRVIVDGSSTSSYSFDCTKFIRGDRSQQYMWFSVAAHNAAGLGSLSPPAQHRCSALPEAPPLPVKVSSTMESITVSYAPGELHGAILTGFKIHVATDVGVPISVDTITDPTQTTFSRYGFTAGNWYQFRVQAVSEVGSSAPSPAARMLAAATPQAPKRIFATPLDNHGVRLFWEPGGNNGGSEIQDFFIYGSTDGTSWPDIQTPTYVASYVSRAHVVNCSDAQVWGGLDMSQQYLYFKIAAVNAAGTGPLSNALRQRCSTAPGPAAAPQKLSGTHSSITVSLSRPAEMNGAPQTGFDILYGEVGGTLKTVTIEATSQAQYTATGLTPGTTYQFQVRAQSETGLGQLSEATEIVCGGLPDAPNPPTYTSSRDNTHLTIGWTFTGSNGGVSITKWKVYISYSWQVWDVENVTVVEIDVGTTAYEIDCQSIGATGTTYNLAQDYFWVKIAGESAVGVGAFSAQKRFFCANLPAAPSSISVSTAVPSTATTITIEWVPGALNGAELQGFYVFMDNGQGGDLHLIAHIEDTSVRRYTAEGLTSNQNFRFEVAVLTTVSEGPRSSILTHRSCGIPGRPDAPTRSANQINSITVKWTEPPKNGCDMDSYKVHWDNPVSITQYGDGVSDGSQPTGAAQFTFERVNLLTGYVYGFQLEAINQMGSSFSDWNYIKVATVPDAPNEASITQNIGAGTSTSIQLVWPEPTVGDLNGGRGTGYIVYRNNGVGTAVSDDKDTTCGMETVPAPQTCLITGLTAGETYTFRLSYVNDVGESEKSGNVAFRSSSVPASMNAPVNTASARTPTLTYTWVQPDGQGADVFNYRGQFHREDDLNLENLVDWNGLGTAGNPFLSTTHTFKAGNDNTDNTQVSSLVSKSQFRLRVCAENMMGVGDWSDWSATDEIPYGRPLNNPDTPTDLARKFPAVIGEITVTWTDIDNENAAGGDNAETVGYEIWGGEENNVTTYGATRIWRGMNPTNEFKFYVDAGDTWSFQIKSFNNAGKESALSTAITLISAAVPGACPNVATTTLDGSVTVTWDAPTDTGGIPLTGYKVSYPGVTETIGTSTFTKTFNAQSEGETVTYTVVATNAVGDGVSSSSSILVDALNPAGPDP
eukprot:gnl/MRDRNA2_/MRDRNA2_76765_c0_seq1.p1 gnl/MRDRNA2_/MRDRNA2_76765_c0~~gnl/MRDRNA2_/MRDRNA2_76765_c0_seq1.p1  ORF type:complete len:1938 (+),score=215.15 gnl/MRDRNA2_/MRDRNA2_76765_c0_seq1:848-5815(+)